MRCVVCLSGLAGCDKFYFQAEDGIRYLVRSRGLGDVYKRQDRVRCSLCRVLLRHRALRARPDQGALSHRARPQACLLYTSDAADERSSVDLGGRRIIKKKKQYDVGGVLTNINNIMSLSR